MMLLLGTADPNLNMYVNKTSTPGVIYCSVVIYARKVFT